MKFLIVGAGALGGYFGGRLLEIGREVTFLVRPRRMAQLDRDGLVVKSQFGDMLFPRPPALLSGEIRSTFDVVIVSCKAYDLPETMESFAAAVGPDTMILPLLNGVAHLDQLTARFGAGHVLGGQCLISATLDAQNVIQHLNDSHTLGFGECDGRNTARIEALSAAFSGAKFDARLSGEIIQEMWEKFVFIASAAGITCLMRSAIGDIAAAGGSAIALQLFEECSSIAAHAGFGPRPSSKERSRAILTTPGSPITASMLKDIERNAPTEADHILGDLLHRADPSLADASVLRIAYTHLKCYGERRAREARSAKSTPFPADALGQVGAAD